MIKSYVFWIFELKFLHFEMKIKFDGMNVLENIVVYLEIFHMQKSSFLEDWPPCW